MMATKVIGASESDSSIIAKVADSLESDSVTFAKLANASESDSAASTHEKRLGIEFHDVRKGC